VQKNPTEVDEMQREKYFWKSFTFITFTPQNDQTSPIAQYSRKTLHTKPVRNLDILLTANGD